MCSEDVWYVPSHLSEQIQISTITNTVKRWKVYSRVNVSSHSFWSSIHGPSSLYLEIYMVYTNLGKLLYIICEYQKLVFYWLPKAIWQEVNTVRNGPSPENVISNINKLWRTDNCEIVKSEHRIGGWHSHFSVYKWPVVKWALYFIGCIVPLFLLIKIFIYIFRNHEGGGTPNHLSLRRQN